MMRFAGIVSAIALLFGSATICAGQETPGETVASALTEGTRVRVLWTTVRTRVSGIVVAADETTITLAPDGGLPLKIPLRSMAEVEVSLGTKGNTLKGLAIGVLGGIASGFAVSVDPENCGPESTSFCSRGEAVGAFAVVLGGIGAAVGWVIRTERWAPISVGFRTSGGAKGRATEVAMAIRF
jgi:hypothetical protein